MLATKHLNSSHQVEADPLVFLVFPGGDGRAQVYEDAGAGPYTPRPPRERRGHSQPPTIPVFRPSFCRITK